MPKSAHFDIAIDGPAGLLTIEIECDSKQKLKSIAMGAVDQYYKLCEKVNILPHGDGVEIIRATSMPKKRLAKS